MTTNICINDFAKKITKLTQHDRIMVLNIFINDEVLKEKYVSSALEHNSKIYEDPYYYDSGFDLYLPNYQTFNQGLNKVDYNIQCSSQMLYVYNMKHYDTGYYIYPRSSITKTPLRLANNTGIIDAGYRGNIIGMFDNISNKSCDYIQYTRLVQICAPNLAPIYVNIVSSLDELGPNTRRGSGGFGSTGI
jgi:dUTP pyrophosphatase